MKRNWKKLLVFAILFTLLLVGATVYLVNHLSVRGCNLYFVEKTGTVHGCDETIRWVYIPAEIDGVAVERIAMGAFNQHDNLTKVSIPASVTDIGWGAFQDCSSLRGIWVDPDNPVYSSDENGVLFNKDKTQLIFCPTTCEGAYVIPDGVTHIGDGAFWGCDNLTSVSIPDSVTHIGDDFFTNCKGLDSVTLPSSVSSISDGAFNSAWYLRGIWVDPDNPTYSNDENGVLYNKEKTKLIACPHGYRGVYVIPDGVTCIGNRAFRNCGFLKGVSIPDSVTHIGDEAFSSCSDLGGVSIPDSVTHIGDGAFSGCGDLTSMLISDSVTHISDWAFSYCYKLMSMPIPDGVTHIGDGAFSGCENLRSVSIPDGVTHIGDRAFSGCENLMSVSIPDSVTHIGGGAFWGCENLTSVTLPNSVSSIGDGAFAYCAGLTSVTLPDSVATIGHSAFENSGVTAVYFMGNAPELGYYAFDTEERPTIYYIEGTSGWTDPMWKDYPTATWNPDAPGN